MTPRPRLTWGDLQGKRVGIYGLGVEGRINLDACRARGIDPVVIDDNPDAAADLDISVLGTEPDGLGALADCDVVIKSPGISRYGAAVRQLIAHGVAVVGGLGLWLAETDLTRVLLVTGTKGKSTTTAMAGHLLSRWGYRVLVGGNIGRVPYAPDTAQDFDYAVIEVSSYQATDLAVSSPVTAVTSLGPDHLPWHAGDVETYYRDKLSATSQPGARITIANGDSATLRAHERFLGPHITWVRTSEQPDETWPARFGLLGVHNYRNALIAREALRAMGVEEALDRDRLAEAASGFTGLPSRLHVVHRTGGVEFIDDSLSTNALSAVAAVDAFPDRKVALLVGGQSRGIDYRPLARALDARTASYLVVTMPTNGTDVRNQLSGAAPELAGSIVDAASLDEAVGVAAGWAKPDGVVLLSPAAPSFDLFRDYRARGDAFAEVAQRV